MGVSSREITMEDPTQHTMWYANNGTQVHAPLGTGAGESMYAGHAMRREKLEKSTSPHPVTVPPEPSRTTSSPSTEFYGGVEWSTEDFLTAHNSVVSSGRFNYEGCMIPIPTSIRYDRLEEALGNSITPKESKFIKLLKFGMPIGCKPGFGVSKIKKNHYSAVCHSEAIGEYLAKSVMSQAMLGPFDIPPISGLKFSPMMTVPKDGNKRRVIMDFSFPEGSSINDGISVATYLGENISFDLPSVQSMVSRVNELGKGCLLFKRDLKGAFRQFGLDPSEYCCTGLVWCDKIFIDTRLAMGLRSSAYCCQAITEMVAKVVSKSAHILVYLDDFGGAEPVEKAATSFDLLGNMLQHFGLEEAAEKAIAPTTSMDWLGVHFDTVEWTISLRQGKLEELLEWLPKLLRRKRVKKVLLQKVLGSLVWASAVVRSGIIFFNRLLALLRKIKRPNHSIHFSMEAKRDVDWWIQTLKEFQGKAPIPPVVWTPLVSFFTDASLDGFGMVWGSRALAGLFPSEYDSLDINKKEMITVMAAIKHWFQDLANLKVKIYVDNQACVALLNYGITKCPFLANCLREIQYFLAKFNIEIRAEYIPSKSNHLADLCSRAFSSDIHFRNFNKLLTQGTLIIENVFYNKFGFEYVL